MAMSAGRRSGDFTPPKGVVIVDLDSDDDTELLELGPEKWTEPHRRRLSWPSPPREEEVMRARLSAPPYVSLSPRGWVPSHQLVDEQHLQLREKMTTSGGQSRSRISTPLSAASAGRKELPSSSPTRSERPVAESEQQPERRLSLRSLGGDVSDSPRQHPAVREELDETTDDALRASQTCAPSLPLLPARSPTPPATLALVLCNGIMHRQPADGRRLSSDQSAGDEAAAEGQGAEGVAEEQGRDRDESSEHDDRDLVEIDEQDWRQSLKRRRSDGPVERGERGRNGGRLSISPPLSRALSPHPVRVRARPLRNRSRPNDGDQSSPSSGCRRPHLRAAPSSPRKGYNRLLALAQHPQPRQPLPPRRPAARYHVEITFVSDEGVEEDSGQETPSSSLSPTALRTLVLEDDFGQSPSYAVSIHDRRSLGRSLSSSAFRGHLNSRGTSTLHETDQPDRDPGDDGHDVKRLRKRGGGEEAGALGASAANVTEGGGDGVSGTVGSLRGKRKLRHAAGSLLLRRSPRVELQMVSASNKLAVNKAAAAASGLCNGETLRTGPARATIHQTGSCDPNHHQINSTSFGGGGEPAPRHWQRMDDLDLSRLNESEARRMVKQTLRHFNALFLRYVQLEEIRAKATKGSSRPDLRAFSEMRNAGAFVNRNKKIIGHVPGVKPGDRFYARCEMCVVGLHPSWMNGIGTARPNETDCGVTLAVAIVLSGGYEDDLDKGEELVYTGEGGNDITGGRGQVKDQNPESVGNKGMRNSMELGEPVRVVRGHNSPNTFTKRVYTYDGLYQVVSTWEEVGISGFRVIKFRLRRLPDQPPLTTDLVEFRPKSVKFTPAGVVCDDIANGLERKKVVAVNTIDDPPVPPPPFEYITRRVELEGLVPHVRQKGCNCKDKCTDPSVCECARKNGGSFPYVRSGGPRLVRATSVVYECGPNCSCGPDCLNRTTQQGLQFRFEVFKTENKGWGLRSWDSIPAGSFVCEYAGRVLKDTDGEKVDCDEYLFDLDLLRIMKYSAKSRWGDVPSVEETDEDAAKLLADLHDDSVDYCMDASKAGNVSRFANHSCSPNMFVQCVLHDHHDLELPHICLFAGEHIPALQELTYDYAYEVNSVLQADGTHRHRMCYCGATDCRGVLY